MKSRAETPQKTTGASKGVPQARIRRAPRLVPFLASGFILGGILGLFWGKSGDNGGYTTNAGAGYLFLMFGVIGLAIGGVAFILADKRS